MTKIKLCGLTRPCDIEYVNELLPEYIGFVFAPKSRRYISPEKAEVLREHLDDRITPVGVFVDENIDVIAGLVKREIIDVVQLHGNENDEYIANLRKEVDCPIIKAFRIESVADILMANNSSADYILLDSGGGTGKVFDHSLLKDIARPYFLAEGLTPENVKTAVKQLAPFAVDASSSLETDGFKDKNKMTAFVKAVRKD
ncbi:MAG: phosphoribosylanthranilate isomerase [Oscillospiraceae bacterium]|nr:phosphoribosylanthranilate isomerase [Oscillospiraceae bacterium]